MERIYGKSIYEGIVIAEPYLKGQSNLEIESFSVSEENLEKDMNTQFREQRINFLILYMI